MNICIFGAASNEIDSCYIEKTEQLGREAAQRGHNLIFGAGANGLMGAAARGVSRAGGKVTGIIPSFFKDEAIEKIYEKCDELIYTETMHQRKSKMEELADAFIITPGGIGTFEEFFEILTLKQLGRHKKPIAMYNINGYYDNLEALLHESSAHGFIRSKCHLLYLCTEDIDEIFDYIENGGDMSLSVHELKNG